MLSMFLICAAMTVVGSQSGPRFTAVPTSGQAPLTVTFAASAGDADPNTFYIDFGDGTTGAIAALSLQHTYSTTGTYTAGLKRSASAGGATVLTATITVGGT